MDESSEVSSINKSKSKNYILESNIGYPCNNSHQTEPSTLSSDSGEIGVIGIRKSKDLMERSDYMIPRKKGTRWQSSRKKGKSAKLLQKSDDCRIQPVKKSSKTIWKNRSEWSKSKIASFASSSKCTADSTDMIEPGPAEMHDEDTFWDKDINSKKSRKTVWSYVYKTYGS